MNTSKTYVYNDTEIKLTGRTATRTSTRGQTATLYEITPASDHDLTWKKWVELNKLYEIQQSKPLTFDAEAVRSAQEENATLHAESAFPSEIFQHLRERHK